jgi:intracellular sulfur oxidation DsrE/DsrF family protein
MSTVITKKSCKKKTNLLISCFYNSPNPSTLPIGFDWTQIISTEYEKKYNVTILLHGECIPHGLNNKTYEKKFGVPNPFADFLEKLFVKNKVVIVICHLCLANDGYNDDQLLKFILPIPFSINFIAQSQLKGYLVIYDAQIKNSHSGFLKNSSTLSSKVDFSKQ